MKLSVVTCVWTTPPIVEAGVVIANSVLGAGIDSVVENGIDSVVEAETVETETDLAVETDTVVVSTLAVVLITAKKY